MRIFKLLALGAFAIAAASAQQCSGSFTLTSAGQTSSSFDNRTKGCVGWTVTYNATGFSDLSLDFQSADDAGAPMFVSFAGAVTSGVNPNTSTTANSTQLTGYFPYVRISLSTATGTGTVRGTFQGFVADPTSGGGGSIPNPLPIAGCGGSGSPPACNPVLIAGVDPTGVLIAPLMSQEGNTTTALDTGDIGGAQFEAAMVCNLQAAIAVTASGLSQLIALTSNSEIRVCHVSMSGDAAVNVKFSTGTGSACGTGTADLTGLYYGVNSLALDFGPASNLRVPTSQALCVSLSGAANWGGVVIYSKFKH